MLIVKAISIRILASWNSSSMRYHNNQYLDFYTLISFTTLRFNNNTNPFTETYPDFYVADGGIVPTSIGVNSSLTISALAFKIAENIVTSDHLPVEAATIGAKTIYFPK
jgi:hypothetical protein